METFDPPREAIMLAFAEAIDGWGTVEWELMISFNLIAKINDLNMTWAVFNSAGSVRAQLDMMDGAAEVSLPANVVKTVRTLTKRTRKLSSKRNAIVHGKWRTRHEGPWDNSRVIMFRDFTREPFGSKPQNVREDAQLHGRVRFYLADLIRANLEFRTLALDLLNHRPELLGFPRQ